LDLLQQESVRQNDRPFIENRHKFVLCKSTSGHKHALEEVLSDPAVRKQLKETKVAKEVEILNTFMNTLNDDPHRAHSGYQHVAAAQQSLAIQSLLVTDPLFRNSNVKLRQQYVQLVEDVKQGGGQVYIFSSMHVSGQQLAQVSGGAAILRFPLPDLDELEEIAAQEPATMDEPPEDYDPTWRIREDVADMGLFQQQADFVNHNKTNYFVVLVVAVSQSPAHSIGSRTISGAEKQYYDPNFALCV
jgi:protein pelota